MREVTDKDVKEHSYFELSCECCGDTVRTRYNVTERFPHYRITKHGLLVCGDCAEQYGDDAKRPKRG